MGRDFVALVRLGNGQYKAIGITEKGDELHRTALSDTEALRQLRNAMRMQRELTQGTQDKQSLDDE